MFERKLLPQDFCITKSEISDSERKRKVRTFFMMLTLVIAAAASISSAYTCPKYQTGRNQGAVRITYPADGGTYTMNSWDYAMDFYGVYSGKAPPSNCRIFGGIRGYDGNGKPGKDVYIFGQLTPNGKGSWYLTYPGDPYTHRMAYPWSPYKNNDYDFLIFRFQNEAEAKQARASLIAGKSGPFHLDSKDIIIHKVRITRVFADM